MSCYRLYRFARRRFASQVFVLMLALLSIAPSPALARTEDAQVPYWASLRANEINMRVGPGEDYRISWVFHRQHLPVKVLRIVEGRRLVQDPDGARGWMMMRFLSRDRTAFVAGKDQAEMHSAPDADSNLLWKLNPGVVGHVGDCKLGWCRLDVTGRVGFVRQENLWGIGDP